MACICGLHYVFFFFFFLRFHLFIFREGKGGREGEKHQCVVASYMPPAGDLAHNPGMCPNRELNLQPFGLQDDAQPVEPYRPGQSCYLFFSLSGINETEE